MERPYADVQQDCDSCELVTVSRDASMTEMRQLQPPDDFTALSDRFQLAVGKPDHFQKQPAVAKPRDLRLAKGACLVVDRRLDDFEVLFGCAENQIEIAERVEIAEIAALSGQHFIVLAQQHLGAAQRIRQAGVDEIAEKISKEAVGDQIERAHRLAVYTIDPG